MSTFFDFLLRNLALDHPNIRVASGFAEKTANKKGPIKGPFFNHCSRRLLFVKAAGCVE